MSNQDRPSRPAAVSGGPMSRAEEDPKRVDEVIQAAEARREAIKAYLKGIEESEATQPARLAEARRQAARAMQECLASESETWDATIVAIPTMDAETGEMTGLFGLPTIDGTELWGARLACDLLGCAANEDQVDAIMNEYFGTIREPGHMFLVCAAALTTIATYVVPQMLDDIEQYGSNYDARVLLADAARNAWAMRAADARDVWDSMQQPP
jgi:hypothetical protein